MGNNRSPGFRTFSPFSGVVKAASQAKVTAYRGLGTAAGVGGSIGNTRPTLPGTNVRHTGAAAPNGLRRVRGQWG